MEKENSIKTILENIQKEIEKIQNTLEVINLKGKNWKTDIANIFLILELSRFLDMEYEATKIDLKTRIPLKDYDLLVKENVDIIEKVFDYYYNTDIGTSYDDFEKILETTIFELKEALEWEKIQNQRK